MVGNIEALFNSSLCSPFILEPPFFVSEQKARGLKFSSPWFSSPGCFHCTLLLPRRVGPACSLALSHCLHIWGLASWEVWQHVRLYILKTALQKRPRLADLPTKWACLFSGAAILNHTGPPDLDALTQEFSKISGRIYHCPINSLSLIYFP